MATAAALLVNEQVSPEVWARFQVAFHRKYGPFAREGCPPPIGAVFAAGAVGKRAGWCRSEALEHAPILATTVSREDVERMLRERETRMRAENPGADPLTYFPLFPRWYREKRRAEAA